MDIKIDIDWLVIEAASHRMQNDYTHESVCIVRALQDQLGDINLTVLVREKVKEYKKLTMWRE